MLISHELERYKQAILSLPLHTQLTKADLLIHDLLMKRSGKLEVYYAPHNEYLNPSAQVVIIGLTPGWTQMRIAIREAKLGLEAGLNDEDVCRAAKEAAGFAGTMRVNLLQMLLALGLHRYLNIASCEELFGEQRGLLHTTSMLKFPVFVNGKNYNGAHPQLFTTPFLREAALSYVREELPYMNQALLIPLGRTVESVLQLLVHEGELDAGQCLWGFPHPSGANGHRHRQFVDHEDSMRHSLRAWFEHKE